MKKHKNKILEKSLMWVKLSVVMMFMCQSQYVLSWGKTGHRVVGELAYQKLSAKVQKKVKAILGFESMAEASLWPDRIKSDPKLRRKYSKMHYLSVPKKKKWKNISYDKKDNILKSLAMFEKELKSKKTSPGDQKIALRFLIHLMGDLHQPLHLGFKKDEGGNKIKLKWFGKKTNFHAVWDEHLIDMEKLSYTEYTKKLSLQNPKVLAKYRNGNYLSWAKESRELLSDIYNFKQSKFWEYSYSYHHLKTVDKRLTQAGIRLAWILETIFKD